MDEILKQFALVFPEINNIFNAGLMVFMRLAGLMRLAPVLSKSEIPAIARISFAMICTVIMTGILKPAPVPADCPIFFCMFLNFAFGALIGFVGNCIVAAVTAGGDMINTQMGMSSAMVMDPSSKTQVSLMSNYFSTLTVIIFMYSGGIYWIFNAFIKSFSIFPMYSLDFHFEKIINIQYLSDITSNILFMGLHIAAPIVLATLAQDIILGLISKTAPQINVFSLSFLFKPVMGAFILVVILPMLINVITTYLASFAGIF